MNSFPEVKHSFPTIKHDTDGKIFYEEDGKVHWVVEVPIYVGDNVALAFNRVIKLVEDRLNQKTTLKDGMIDV